jgi:hypothetical protein
MRHQVEEERNKVRFLLKSGRHLGAAQIMCGFTEFTPTLHSGREAALVPPSFTVPEIPLPWFFRLEFQD